MHRIIVEQPMALAAPDLCNWALSSLGCIADGIQLPDQVFWYPLEYLDDIYTAKTVVLCWQAFAEHV